jgi:hypothetical protein
MLVLQEEEGMQQLPLLAPQPLFSFLKKKIFRTTRHRDHRVTLLADSSRWRLWIWWWGRGMSEEEEEEKEKEVMMDSGVIWVTLRGLRLGFESIRVVPTRSSEI